MVKVIFFFSNNLPIILWLHTISCTMLKVHFPQRYGRSSLGTNAIKLIRCCSTLITVLFSVKKIDTTVSKCYTY